MARQQDAAPQGRQQAGNPGQEGQRGRQPGQGTPGTTDVRCSSCDQTFHSRDELRQHEQKMHRGQSRS